MLARQGPAVGHGVGWTTCGLAPVCGKQILVDRKLVTNLLEDLGLQKVVATPGTIICRFVIRLFRIRVCGLPKSEKAQRASFNDQKKLKYNEN